MLMLFLWGMLMITEFRAIYNFAFVVWKTPSTSNTDANFAKIEDSKMLVLQLPMAHKYFALFCIALPRFLIGLVILVVGTNFLTSTNNLLDLVLNSTVAWRNQPVRDFVGWGKNWMISDEHCTLFVSKSVPVSLLQAHYILGMSSQKFARAILPSCEGPSVKKIESLSDHHPSIPRPSISFCARQIHEALSFLVEVDEMIHASLRFMVSMIDKYIDIIRLYLSISFRIHPLCFHILIDSSSGTRYDSVWPKILQPSIPTLGMHWFVVLQVVGRCKT